VREAIPADLKRRVRQRCGFGCVICGSPIWDYDHIEEYATVKEHTYENLVLLCPTCHRKKTNGLIAKESILTAIENVDNRSRTSADEIPPQFYTLDIGSNIVQTFAGLAFTIYEFGALWIIFKEYPMINAVLMDKNGEKAIEIAENNYTLCSNTWDIEYVGKTLTFRNGPRMIFASITFDVGNKVILLRGNIELSNGVRIKITDTGIFADQQLLASGNKISQSGAGLTITDQPIEHPYWVSGTVSHNLFYGINAIAVLNSRECKNNIFGKCQCCFVWTKSFLDNLKNA